MMNRRLTERGARLSKRRRLKILLIGFGGIVAAFAASMPAAASTANLTTADTAIRVEANDGRLAITMLRCRATSWNWIPSGGTASSIPLIGAAEINGKTIALHWRLAGQHLEKKKSKRAIFTFRCQEPDLDLQSIWTAAPGPGPIEHTIAIMNRGSRAVLLPMQSTLRFTAYAPAGHTLTDWWVEKGGSRPGDEGTHHDAITPGFQRLLISTPHAGDDQPRDAIPWTTVQDQNAPRGWYAGIEFSGRTTFSLHSVPSHSGTGIGVQAELGIGTGEGSAAPAQTLLQPGETWQAPVVFVGCYTGSVDDGANRLRRWVERTLRPPVSNTHYPLLTVNSWGTGMEINESLARRMADDAASLGLEMVHIDAGWFRGVGDWRPDPAKFPHGLAALADYVHGRGLKFGLWVGWMQGGVDPDTADRQLILNVFAPDRKEWFSGSYAPDWKPGPFTGATLCLSDLAADNWCLSLLDRLVREYHLDMLEHDQQMIVDDCVQTTHPHTASPADVAYYATRGYYRVYDALRARHPGLLFEDCVNGGHAVDYGIIRRVDHISITDTYTPLANRRAFFDASYALPPSMCECYVENEAVTTPAEFETMLRSGMMGWCTIMCDTTKWTAEQHDIARRQFSLYKTWLRPLIRAGDLYHASDRPDGVHWDGIQYADPAGNRAVLFAFRGSTAENSHIFPLRGLKPDSRYRVSFEDGSEPGFERTGRELMAQGITVSLAQPGSSQIVLLSRPR